MGKTEKLVKAVKQVIHDRLVENSVFKKNITDPATLISGKLLRTHFAARLFNAAPSTQQFDTVKYACAGIEATHAATLLHDDVIDRAAMRRGNPVIWKTLGQNSSILIGDLFLCEAFTFILKADNGQNGRFTHNFNIKVREVCTAEIEQELELRGRSLDENTCIRIARNKTGALFAFLGYVCGGNDTSLSSALENAGYQLGTAYQIADDLLDAVGDENIAGKTLGTDSKRSKYTLPCNSDNEMDRIFNIIHKCIKTAIHSVRPWPDHHRGLMDYLTQDFQPILDKYIRYSDFSLKTAI